jgi:hypothetical protein
LAIGTFEMSAELGLSIIGLVNRVYWWKVEVVIVRMNNSRPRQDFTKMIIKVDYESLI